MTASFRVTAASASIRGVESPSVATRFRLSSAHSGGYVASAICPGAVVNGGHDFGVCETRIVEASAYTVKALDESTWPAFAALVHDAGRLAINCEDTRAWSCRWSSLRARGDGANSSGVPMAPVRRC